MIKDKKVVGLNNENVLEKKQNEVAKTQQKTQTQSVVKNASQSKSNLNTNDTFFEKFDKTKKEHKESVKKLKWSSRSKSKSKSGILTSFDKKLQSNNYLLKVYGSIALGSAIVITLGILLFVLLLGFFNGTPSTLPNEIGIAKPFYEFLRDIQFAVKPEVYQPLAQTVVILSMIAAGIVLTPIVYMVSSWFVGFNNIQREKKFVMAYFWIIIIALILLFISLILLFAIAWGPFGPFNYPLQPAS